MLKELNVENYALIDALDISFSRGMSIITGETGAGKSILLGALSLVLGGRADSGVLKDKSRNCVVEAMFDIEGCGLEHLFAENEMDYEPHMTVRRTINTSGKSRAFVNDNPVNASLLREIGARLLDIHSQHENLLLASSRFQLSVLDAVTDFGSLKSDYRNYFRAYKAEEKRLQELTAAAAAAKADYDYVKFQFEQLSEARLREGEREELEEELRELSNAEDIKAGYEKLAALFSGDEISLVNFIREADTLLSKLKKVHSASGELAGRVDECLVEIKDIASDIAVINDSLEPNPERLAYVEERLNTIYDLLKKHRVTDIADLVAIRLKYETSLIETDNFDEMMEKVRKTMNENLEKVKQLAKRISTLRHKSLPPMEQHVTSLLKSLGMPNVVFKPELSTSETFSPEGTDEIVFLFSANKDMSPKEISKVASGGEMSRLMLALKSLLVKGSELPTIIFDEIDTGISGEVADKMGDIIRDLSRMTQVINITHLPQVAAKGNNHYLVYKEDGDNGTYTKVRKLDDNERVTEIAKMLSGAKITDAALEHAKELLQ